ncbi:hypothetical protein D3C71_1942710 [compost metagenome]
MFGPVDLQPAKTVFQVETGRRLQVEAGHAIVQVLAQGGRQLPAVGPQAVMGAAHFSHRVDLDHDVHAAGRHRVLGQRQAVVAGVAAMQEVDAHRWR